MRDNFFCKSPHFWVEHFQALNLFWCRKLNSEVWTNRTLTVYPWQCDPIFQTRFEVSCFKVFEMLPACHLFQLNQSFLKFHKSNFLPFMIMKYTLLWCIIFFLHAFCLYYMAWAFFQKTVHDLQDRIGDRLLTNKTLNG